MRRIQDVDAVASQPSLPVLTGNVGFFFNGNAATGEAATPVPDWWLNMTQEELCAFLTAAGLPLDGTHTVLEAAQSMWGSNGFSRLQIITTTTTWVVPAGVTLVRPTVIGGGGPGGSTAACDGSQISTAPGGNAGCIATGIYTVAPGQSIVATVGPGGVASLSGGSNGGTSSFGALCTAPGGQAASNVPANPPPLTQGSTLATRQASGGMINGFEAQGLPSISGTLENVFSGKGADCGDFGAGGSGQGLATTVGIAGRGFGAGGGGAVTASGGAAQLGGNGAPGAVILEY